MLKPLQQWTCDSCGQVINAPEEGYVEWRTAWQGRMDCFHIVHDGQHQPKNAVRSCYYQNSEKGGVLRISDLLALPGLLLLTSWVEPKNWDGEDYEQPTVSDLFEWLTLFRRLHIPYFEEARHLEKELQELRAGGANEVYLLLPDTLKRIIEEHEHRTHR